MNERQLSTLEVVDFLSRHWVTATEVAETKATIATGLYDFDYNPATEWKLPGVIPPWGQVVADVYYGNVLVQPRPDQFYYTGWITADSSVINAPPYVPPDAGLLPTSEEIQNAAITAGVLIVGLVLASSIISKRL